MRLAKYLTVFRISWMNGFVYRLNFVMWRVRNIIQLLTLYFLWSAVSASQGQIFSYSRSAILTYVLGGSIIRTIVLSSRSIDAQGEIATGDLNNYLIRPLNYFFYWVTRDIADKLLNIFFVVIEVTLLILLLKPPIFIQPNISNLILFTLSLILATILFFIFSFVISMTTFWYYEYNGWPQRFLSFVLIESLAGYLFPLDMLPSFFAKLVSSLPPAYFIYFPLQLYLGRLSPSQILQGFAVLIFWIPTLYLLSQKLWHQGLKIYGAFGR